jgi:elongation factor P hydroxylase
MAVELARKAVEVMPEGYIWNTLGVANYRAGNWQEALQALNRSMQLRQGGDGSDWFFLGMTYWQLGDKDLARKWYEQGVQKSSKALDQGLRLHPSVRLALMEICRYRDEATALLKIDGQTSDRVRNHERLVECEAKLPKVLKGEVQPADYAERLALAQICQEHKSLPLTAFRFYSAAFAEKPDLTDDLQAHLRSNAAYAAAYAGCGRGRDADQTDDTERSRLRYQALEWLRADLAAYRSLLEKDPDQARAEVQRWMYHWQHNIELSVVRSFALAERSQAEREEWQKFWQEVEALRQQAKDATKAPAPKKPGQ